ncbi:MAG: hypothetical protein JEZ03_13675, partial [Bacteroidales bacterium]|nr:hypothetical protein [Bacteroidales bacterium]
VEEVKHETVVDVTNVPVKNLEISERIIHDTVYHTRYIYDTIVQTDTLILSDTIIKVDSLVIEHFPDLNDSIYISFSMIYGQVFQHNNYKTSANINSDVVGLLNDKENISSYNYNIRAMLDVNIRNTILSTGIGFLKVGENYNYENIIASGGYYDIDTVDRYWTPSGINDTNWVYVLDSTWMDYHESVSMVNNPNSYTYLEIPLLAGYTKQFGRIKLNARAGISTGILLNTAGRTINPWGIDESIALSKNIVANFLLFSEIHGRISYALSDYVDLISGLSYKRSLTSSLKTDFPIHKNMNLLNFNVGFSIRL